MEKLKKCLENLAINQRSIYDLYNLLTTIQLENFEITEAVYDINKLILNESVDKELVYLSLLTNKNENIIKTFIEYEIESKLDLRNSLTLFMTSYYKRQHWFKQVIQDEFNIELFENKLQQEIKILRLIDGTNKEIIDVKKIGESLATVGPYRSEFINAYLTEIKFVLNILTFIKSNCDNIDDTELFNYITKHSFLETCCKYLSLDLESCWDDVSNKLVDEERHESIYHCNCEIDYYSDLEIFKAFTIIHSLIKAVKLSRANDGAGITEMIDKCRERFCSLSNRKLQMDLLEDIFTLCFIRTSHFDANPVSSFLCSANELRLILLFLKSCFEEINVKKLISIGLEENVRLNELSKYVIDGLWRLEMVTEVKEDAGARTMEYMLAKPESLIKICLENDVFEKAHQVIHIFNLHDSDLAKEICYTERLIDLRKNILKAIKIKEYHIDSPNITILPESSINSIIKDFYDNETKEANAKFYDIFDIALTLPTNYKHSKELLNIANYMSDETENNFYKKIVEVIDYIGLNNNLSVPQILNNPEYSLDLDKYKSECVFYDNLTSIVAIFNNQFENQQNHKSAIHKTYQRLMELVKSESTEGIKYLSRLYTYLRSYVATFHIGGNFTRVATNKGKLSSCFEILSFGTSEILGKLIFEKELDPQDFEHLYGKLKIDLLYHISSNCFPKIGLNKDSSTTQRPYVPTTDVIGFIQKRNWLLAFILCEIHGIKEFNLDINQNRTKYLNNYSNLLEINNLKLIFNDNAIVTALQKNYLQFCLGYIKKNVFHDDDKDLENDSLETAEEISEGDYRCDWKYVLLILDSIPEYQTKDNETFFAMKDKILSNLVVDQFEEDRYKYVQYIVSDSLRISLILSNFHTWPGDFCVMLLKSETSKKFDEDIMKWLKIVEFSEEVKNLFEYNLWHDVYVLCRYDPELIVDKLLTTSKVTLLLNFTYLFETNTILQKKISLNYIELLFNQKETLNDIQKLMSLLPTDLLIDICQNLIKLLKNIDSLQFVLNCLAETPYENLNYIKNVQISLNILQHFTQNEQEQMLCLINDPLNIIETLIMNTKLDKLGYVMEMLKDDLTNCEFNENQISIESIDELLRKYAEKSLEFRVILDLHPKLLKDSDTKLMQSLDSIYGPDRKYFVMPVNVPDKSEWVPNNEVLECMCCQNTTFSMFNRRHHCRRCGRVICFNCSTRRMQVETYGDVLVRVCIDCYDQSHADNSSTFSDTTSTRSILYDCFILTENADHNQIVRQEFSYEHAPSVSLCLSIMKHHSRTMNYPIFLLDQCDNMLKLIQPLAPNAPQEIDYPLVIKMLKSLAIAAKMLSPECHLQWGTSFADRILSQADLLGLLAERGCLNLIPTSSYNGAPYVDATVLRRLRDKLLETEQWKFALDVSTKAGLDNAVVFAAWGKNCLRAGCFQMAREKFQRCFDKIGHYDFSDYSQSMEVLDDSIDTPTHRKRYHSKISTCSETKPLKNSSLLNQIIVILELQTVIFNNKFTKDVAGKMNKSYKGIISNNAAIMIKYKLRNLKAVAAGNYEPDEIFGATLEPMVFDECLYYLCNYGNHLSLLQFYLKYNYVHESLHYIIDNNVGSEVFIEVYMLCLKEGKVNDLQEGMSAIDHTLDIWKDHLRNICRHLELQSLLNSLYQLQQFMGDYVRAAMTCIRFYKDRASSYKELNANLNYLQQAKSHLKQELEQKQWVEVNAVRKMSSDSKNDYEEKALTNPSLVMKMDTRNINNHINTITRQIEITKFLANYEDNIDLIDILQYTAPTSESDTNGNSNKTQIPTLFDSQYEKIQVCVLAIICSENVEDGYRMAFEIMQDYKLKSLKVYCQAARILAKEERYNGIAQLVSCIRSSGLNDTAVTDMCDEMLALAVRTLSTNNASSSQLETLIKLITDRATKITIYIETKQLKSAYILAAKYNRFGDIRRILREAELLNKHDIKKLCQKLLQAHSHSHKD